MAKSRVKWIIQISEMFYFDEDSGAAWLTRHRWTQLRRRAGPEHVCTSDNTIYMCKKESIFGRIVPTVKGGEADYAAGDITNMQKVGEEFTPTSFGQIGRLNPSLVTRAQ